ncbi:MAG: PQQ-binding-like beta-propeller repeat protein, partial [Planctomicrobium sp.]|nr:PQQ-binding-like beta-propeller repeat protein [Planctomicrobium sp.]
LERLKQTDPKTLGKVAGQEGVIYEILSRFAESLEFADHDSFLQREDRLPFESVRYDFVALDWSVPVHGNSTVSQVIEPLLWHETLLLQDVNGVRALNIETGQPAWSIGPEDQGYIFETTAFSETSTSIPMVCSGGVLNGHTWYGRSGVDGFLDNKPVDPSQQSRISALDLKAEGRLKWTRTPSDLSLNDQAQMRVFSGTPVVNGVHVYVPMRTSAPGNQLQIACINSEDGSEIWLSEVAASLKIPAKDDGYYDEINIEGISLYWLIDGVSVACIDAFDGQLQWVSAVQPIDEVVKQRVIGSQDLAISEDSILCITVNGIAAFNKFTGKLNWEQYLQDPPRSLLGVNDGLLIANDPGIYAIDVDSGEIVWQRKQLNSNSKPHIGVLKGRSIFYPDQDQLFTLDAYSGRVLQQDQFSNGLELPINGVHVFPSKLMTLHGNELRTFRAHSYTD